MSPTLICLPVGENSKRYPARRCFVPLAPPFNLFRSSFNSHICPRQCPYFALGSGTYLQGVLLAMFALLEAENGEFRVSARSLYRHSAVLISLCPGIHFYFPHFLIFCPLKCLCFMLWFSLRLLENLLPETGKFRPARSLTILPYIPRAVPEPVAVSL